MIFLHLFFYFLAQLLELPEQQHTLRLDNSLPVMGELQNEQCEPVRVVKESPGNKINRLRELLPQNLKL
jgi:hypothetical protein